MMHRPISGTIRLENATGHDSGAVEKEPSAWQRREVAGKKERDGEQAANDDGRSETQYKFAAGAGKQRGIGAMRFGSCSGSGNGDGDESFGEPDGNPSARSSLAMSQPGTGNSGDAHGDPAPSWDGGELGGALHGFADVAKMVGGASVNGDGLVTRRAKRT
jgi:hypothetical protein